MKEDLLKRQCLARIQSWKLLIERDLFDSYSQRINACFNYLDDNGEGFFTLKDVTDRGKFVFTYLGNPLENKNPYAAMDLFRRYDSRGSGEVYLDDFVGGTIRFLQKAANDTQVLNEIINEIVETSSTPMEEFVDNVHLQPGEDYPLEAMECTVTHILEDLDDEGVYNEFRRSVFYPLKYIFKERLRNFEKAETDHFLSGEGAGEIHEDGEITVTVTTSKLRELMVLTLEYAVRELQTYFRLSDRALVSILVPHHTVHDYSRLLHNFSPSKETIEGSANDAFSEIIEKPEAAHKDKEPFWVIKESNKGHAALLERRRKSSIVPVKRPPPKPVVIGANVSGTATPKAIRRFSHHFGVSISGEDTKKKSKKLGSKKIRRLSSKMGIDLQTLLQSGIDPDNLEEDEEAVERVESDEESDEEASFDDLGDAEGDDETILSNTETSNNSFENVNRKKERKKSADANKGTEIWSFLSDCGVTLDDLKDPDIMANLDDAQIFLLKTAFKSLENFMSLLAQEKQYRNRAEAGLLGPSGIFNPYDEGGSSVRHGLVSSRHDIEEAFIQQKLEDELRLSMALASGEDGEDVVEELVRKMRARVTTSSIAETVLPGKEMPPGSVVADKSESSSGIVPLGATKGDTAAAISSGPVNEELLQALVETQSRLKRTEMRLQIMQLVQTKIRRNVNNSLKGDSSRGERVDGPLSETKGEDGEDGDDAEEDAVDRIMASAGSVNKLSKVSQVSFLEKAVDKVVPSSEEILNEIEGMKGILADNGSTDTVLGYMMSTPCALIPLSKQVDYFALDSHGDKGKGKGTNGESGEYKGASATRDLEKLSMSLVNVVKRRVNDERMYSKLAVKAKRLEEQLAENMCKLEEADQEHAELLSNAIELQILRDETFRLRAELATAQVYVTKFEELRKEMSINETTHARKLAEMQKRIDLAQLKGNSKDMDTATSKIQELQHTIQTLTGDRNRLLKENNRLANANTVSDKRVKSALLDHVTLHQRVHVAEDELAASRVHTSRLERDINELRRYKVNNSELVRKIEMMEKEIAQKDTSLGEAEETANHYRRLKAELAAADMHINTLEEKVSSLSIEAEKGTIAAEQLTFTRDTLQEKNTINRELMVENANLVQQVEDLEYEQLNNQQLMDMMEDYKRRSDKVTGLVAEVARLRGLSRAASKALQDSDASLSATRNKLLNLEKDKERFNANANRLKELEEKYSDARNQIEKLKAQLAARPAVESINASGARSSTLSTSASGSGDASKGVPGGVTAPGGRPGTMGSKWEEMQKRRAAEKAQEMEQTALKNAPGSVDARQRQQQTAAGDNAAHDRSSDAATTSAPGGSDDKAEESAGAATKAPSPYAGGTEESKADSGETASSDAKSSAEKEERKSTATDEGSLSGSKKSKKEKKEKKSKDKEDKGIRDDDTEASSGSKKDKKEKKEKKDKKDKKSKDSGKHRVENDRDDDDTEASSGSKKDKKEKKDKKDKESEEVEEKAEGKDKDKKEKRDESPSKRKVKFNDDASGVSSSSTTSKKKVGKLDSKFVNMLGAVLDKDD